MKISILTATYNRVDKLPKLYQSIKSNYNNYTDIEWLIMDDGSSDSTEELINDYINESSFDIKYYKQVNQGKMTAINNLIQYVTGDIVMEVDSDDYLCDNVLSIIASDYESLAENVYGVIYKRHLGDKDISTNDELNDKVVKLFDIHNTYESDFDMNLTFKADVRRKYFYELENNEKFITEARLYYKLDQLYDGLLFRNKEIVVGEYLEDGYSKNISKVFKKYPYGYYEYFKECLGYINNTTKFKRRLYFIKHFILFSYLTKHSKISCIKSSKGLNKLLIILLVIPGYIKSKRF